MDGEMRDDPLQSRAFASAVLLEKIVRGAYENRRSSEVQPLQWSILRYLSIAEKERRTIVWIASFLGVTHAPVVRAMQTLQRRGLVDIEVNAADGRSKIATLSTEGVVMLGEDPLLGVAARIELLDEQERLTLILAIRKLIPLTEPDEERSK